MFGIPSFLIEPLIGLVVAAVLAWGAHHAWVGFKDGIGAEYTAAQIKDDQPKIAAANAAQADAEARATHAQADTASCVNATGTQSDAIKQANARADAAQMATKAILAAAKRDAAARDGEFKRLAAIAAAKPRTDQSCTDALSKADATLRPLLKDRQGVTK